MQPMTAPYGGPRVTMHRQRVIGAVLALVVLLAGCGGSGEEPAGGGGDADGPPEQPVTIRLGHWAATQEILYVMEHLPEVAPNQGSWYEVELTSFGAPSDIPRGIAAGTLEGGGVAGLDLALALEQGADLRIAGCFIEDREGWGSLTWLVRNDSGIGSAADLRGQTIGTPGAGSSMEIHQQYWLREQAGLEPDVDYEQVEVPFPQMADALTQGHIATGPLPPPFLGQALATGEFRPLFKLTDVRPRMVAVLFALSGAFIDEHPEVAAKFMQDWVAVARWIAEPANRQQVLEANSQSTEIPVEVLDRFVLTRQDGYRPPNGAVNQQLLQETWDFYRTQGAVTEPLQVSEHVALELLPPEGDEEAP